MGDGFSTAGANPTPGKMAVAVGFLALVTAGGAVMGANPHRPGLAFLAGLCIGLVANVPALVMTRQAILSVDHVAFRALWWPFRLMMGGLILGVCAGLVIGEPSGENVLVSVVVILFFVPVVEVILPS